MRMPSVRMPSVIVLAMLACASGIARADDLIVAKSAKPVGETLDRLQAIVKADGFFIVARVPHSEAAKGAGLSLPPTELMIFGKPQSGTPIMVCDPRAGIDLPLRAVAWQDQAGQVWLGMHDPETLKQQYALGAACDAPIETMRKTVRGFVADATKP